MAGLNVTDSSFQQEVIKSDIPVLVDFWANWCNPCKMIMPTVEKMANEYAGKLKVCKVDVDSNPDTPSSFGVRSIPTLIFFKNGEIAEQIVGVVSEAQLKKIIDKVLA